MVSDVESCDRLIDEFDEFGQACSCGFDIFAGNFEDFGCLQIGVLSEGLFAQCLGLLLFVFAQAQFLSELSVLP